MIEPRPMIFDYEKERKLLTIVKTKIASNNNTSTPKWENVLGNIDYYLLFSDFVSPRIPIRGKMVSSKASH